MCLLVQCSVKSHSWNPVPHPGILILTSETLSLHTHPLYCILILTPTFSLSPLHPHFLLCILICMSAPSSTPLHPHPHPSTLILTPALHMQTFNPASLHTGMLGTVLTRLGLFLRSSCPKTHCGCHQHCDQVPKCFSRTVCEVERPQWEQENKAESPCGREHGATKNHIELRSKTSFLSIPYAHDCKFPVSRGLLRRQLRIGDVSKLIPHQGNRNGKQKSGVYSVTSTAPQAMQLPW